MNLLCEIEMVWRKYATEVPVATAAAARTLIRIMIMISVYIVCGKFPRGSVVSASFQFILKIKHIEIV